MDPQQYFDLPGVRCPHSKHKDCTPSTKRRRSSRAICSAVSDKCVFCIPDSKILTLLSPGPDAAILLATYDFTLANKLFAFNLVSLRSEHKQQEAPISTVLSFTSYLLHHAYRSSRATIYAYLNLFILRILVEDQMICKYICDGENKNAVRLCRQRPPYLPLTSGDRVLATVVLDIMVDALNHNLRRRLDFKLYM